MNGVIVSQAVQGNDDLWEWRFAGITGNRSISQDQVEGAVDARYFQESVTDPIGLPPDNDFEHEFDFDYDGFNDVWSVALLGDGIDFCAQGDFDENVGIDFSPLDFDDWRSSLGNIEEVTSAWDFVQLVISFPDPYLDLTHVPLGQEYIEALWPLV